MSGWILAIDVGTTSTAAARRVGDRVETIQLQGGPRMPSLVFWREATGTSATGRLVLGTEAEELSSLAPWCLERAPKSRLGEEFIQLGDKQLRPVEIIGAILREVHNEALALSGGEAPAEIRLTHPARWQKTRLEKLEQAANMAGLSDPIFVPEPVAAAVHFASERLAEGEHVAVYDLGGGTLDTAVLKRGRGTFEVIGRTGGDEELGGEDFDDLLYRYLGDQLPPETWQQLRTADTRKDRLWGQANRVLLRHARLAKEGLSRHEQYEFYLPPPIDRELTANVKDFEGLIAPTLRGTVAELERTVLAAGLQTSDLAAIYLAGGSSRIPLVRRLIEERLGIAPEHLDDPKAVIALGAARLDRQEAKDSSVQRGPLEPAGAAIPPLPQGGATPPEPPAPPGDGTELAGPDRGATEPGGRPAPAQPPAQPPGDGKRTGAPREREPAGTPASNGADRRRKGILAGVAAVVVAGIAVAVVLAAGGGGDDGDGGDTGGLTVSDTTGDTTGDTTSDTTDDTTTGDTTDDPPEPPPASPEEELKLMIAAKYRDSCKPEPEKDYEKKAIIGLLCDAPTGFGLAIESFPNRVAMLDAFKVYSAGLPFDGPCDPKWNVRTTWFVTRKQGTEGYLLCKEGSDNNPFIAWTKNDIFAVGFLIGPEGGSISSGVTAWSRVSN